MGRIPLVWIYNFIYPFVLLLWYTRSTPPPYKYRSLTDLTDTKCNDVWKCVLYTRLDHLLQWFRIIIAGTVRIMYHSNNVLIYHVMYKLYFIIYFTLKLWILKLNCLNVCHCVFPCRITWTKRQLFLQVHF